MSNPPLQKDVARRTEPDAVQLQGLLGQRLDASRVNRLSHQEEEHLIWPFRDHCPVGWYPDRQPYPGVRSDWQGEFMGTWIDAAILTAWNAGDAGLREKVDALVARWLTYQDADGYLGTYDSADRWKSWDVWVQAHNLIGLISFYRASGRADVREAAIRIADRVLADFGPGKRSLRETGPHLGMASSAFLEPLMWLYWETGDTRYLDFGRWLVEEDWEGEGGAQILSSLLAGNGVANTANAKGIEMLIDFAGLLELYRATGEQRYKEAVLTAWDDIVRHHLYITGSASTGEYFPKDYVLKNDGLFMIGETCVSMGWLYLNLSLYRLTGEARFLDMAEQTLYNHLLAAQSPDGKYWVYYLGLRDSKRFRWHTDPECCPSRGVRAIAQMPGHIYGLWEDGISVNFYEPSQAVLPVGNGQVVHVDLQTGYPFDGAVRLSFQMETSENFVLRMRLPGWARGWALLVNGETVSSSKEAGFLVVGREWRSGDIVSLELEMPIQVVVDRLGNNGRVAVTRGPLVYAADVHDLPPGMGLDDVIIGLPDSLTDEHMTVQTAGDMIQIQASMLRQREQSSDGWWKEPERYQRLQNASPALEWQDVLLVPFFAAGNRSPRTFREGTQPNDEPVRDVTFQVWLPYLRASQQQS